MNDSPTVPQMALNAINQAVGILDGHRKSCVKEADSLEVRNGRGDQSSDAYLLRLKAAIFERLVNRIKEAADQAGQEFEQATHEAESFKAAGTERKQG